MQLTTVDESGELRELIPIGSHHEERCGDVVLVGYVGGNGRGKSNEPPAAAKHPEQISRGRTADRVDHHVVGRLAVIEGSASDVDYFPRTEISDQLDRVATDRGGHVGTKLRGKLHSQRADPARSPGHQDALPVTHPGVVDKGLPCGESRER